jgi:hypothetical protein
MNYRQVFESVITDARYQANLDWGEPRPGHPEATIRAHIAEIELNLHALRRKLTDEQHWKLMLLIHTHDTFKGEAEPGVPITHPKSHASLARAFLAAYCGDVDLLTMVQLHDEPYALYLQHKSKGACNPVRMDQLINAIKDWNVFLAFVIIDECTRGKSREPLHWFLRSVSTKVDSIITEADILPSSG